MSIIRKSLLASAIVGVGLGSMAGIASANEAPVAGSDGCSNVIEGMSSNGADRALGDVEGGDQAFDASNTCDFLNGNEVLSNTNTAGGDIRNGDETTETTTETTTSETILGDLLAL